MGPWSCMNRQRIIHALAECLPSSRGLGHEEMCFTWLTSPLGRVYPLQSGVGWSGEQRRLLMHLG